jgi:ankyrin repeat protein
VDTVKLLLLRGAPVDVKDENNGKTPLEWALYGWGDSKSLRRADYYEVVALLAQAGAKLDTEWYEDNEVHRRAVEEEMLSDPRMQAALRGEMPH